MFTRANRWALALGHMDERVGEVSVGKLIEWLLTGPPWVAYRTRVELLGEPETAPAIQASRQAMLAHPQVQALLADLAEWPGSILKSHKKAGHLVHKLVFAADLGLRGGDPGLRQVAERIMENQSDEGPFGVLMNINPRYGGTGEDQWAWMLCDAPLLVYALVKLGYGQDERVLQAISHLTSLVRENGWPCAAAAELGRFRGPGRKADPCPYANLVMLRALGQLPSWRASPEARTGVEALLALWEQRTERRPYLFAMGTGFCRLKAPLVWYDILHVTQALTHFAWAASDLRLKAMVDVVRGKADSEGRFTSESIWMDWKGWGFGQKRFPSRWLTLVATTMIRRHDAGVT